MNEMGAGTMSGDWMERMQQGRQEPGKMPCKVLTLDCIAAMGCTIPLFSVPEQGTLGGSLHARQVPFLPAIHQLVGLSTGPEPPPLPACFELSALLPLFYTCQRLTTPASPLCTALSKIH